jgi:hypothetical protein
MGEFTQATRPFSVNNGPSVDSILLTTPNKLMDKFLGITRPEIVKIQLITGGKRMNVFIHQEQV